MNNRLRRFLCLASVLMAMTGLFCSCESRDNEDKDSLTEYGFTGCSLIAYDFFPFAGDVTVELAHRKDMPSWLVDKITSGDDVRHWAVWEGSCDGRTIYLLYNVYTMLFECLFSILRTGGGESARWRSIRADAGLIKQNRQQQQPHQRC